MDTVEQETVEQPVSIEEELAKSFDAQMEPEDEVEDVQQSGDDTDEDTGADDDISDDDEAESEEREGIEDEPDASEDNPEGLTAPEHWPEADRELFETLDPKGQEFLLRRHKEMEADYTRKTQDIAEDRKQIPVLKQFKESIDQVIGPLRNQFAAQGLDDIGAVRSLFGWYTAIQQDPQRIIPALAEQYGVSLEPEQEDNPAISALKKDIADLKAQNQSNTRAQQQAAYNSALQAIETFKTETDEHGNLKHPHFEKVQKSICALMTVEGLDLESAYKKAVRADDELFSEEQKRLKEKEENDKKAKEAEAKKQKAIQAKKAAKSVKSQSASAAKAEPKSVEQELSEIYDAQLNQ